MLKNTDNIYTLGDHTIARALHSFRADHNRHRFLIGTYLAQKYETNQIHLIEYDESFNTTSASGKYVRKVNLQNVYKHPCGWIDSLIPHPTQASLLCSIYSNPAESRKAVLWKMPQEQDAKHEQLEEEKDSKKPLELEKVADIPSQHSVRNIEWEEEEEQQVTFEGYGMEGASETPVQEQQQKEKKEALMKLIAADLGGFSYWDLENSLLKGNEDPELRVNGPTWKQYVQKAVRDPNQKHLVSCAFQNNISCFDMRSKKAAYKIPQAHSARVLDLDYNPNKPYNLVSGGQDCTVKFWDVRKERMPLKVLKDFTHWVQSVKFNPSHDQLVITGSSSTTVKLWRMLSVSSAALTYDLTATAPSSGGGSYDISEKDILVSTYEHQDSIYETAWSAADAWVFASLSYNGNVLISTVPNNEKFMILL